MTSQSEEVSDGREDVFTNIESDEITSGTIESVKEEIADLIALSKAGK